MQIKWLVASVALLALLLLPGEVYRPSPAGAQEAVGATVSGTVEVQGSASNAGVTVQLGLDTVVTAADGAFSFSDVPIGIYIVLAETPGYLTARSVALEVFTTDPVDTGLLVVLAGDVNDDGMVDSDDFDSIAAELGNSPPRNPVVDYSGDGKVDVLDLVLATGNRGNSEAGGPAIDTTTLSGVVTDQSDGSILQDVSATVQVDLNEDGIFAPVGQGVLLPGLTQSFDETYQQQTDLQGSFDFNAVPFQKDGVSLEVQLELQKEGYGTFSKDLALSGNTVLSVPMEISQVLEDLDISDGVQLTLTGSPAEVEVNVPLEAVPPGVTSVTGFVNYDNPRDARDLFPGNYRAADDNLGEVQLESTVYAQIDLRDQDGNPILDTSGDIPMLADLRLQVPPDQYPTLRDMTPDNRDVVNVPLYSFDYEEGIWRPSDNVGRLEAEDGTPINQDQLLSIWKGEFTGTLYVAGQVDHFSRWNVDYPVSSHSAVCGQIVDITGSPIRDAQVRSYGTTYLSNFSKAQRTSGSGTFCDDFKVSEEAEAEEEEERSPPAVRVLESGMSGEAQFGVRVEVRYQGDDTDRSLTVKVKLTNEGKTAPFATLEREVKPAKGPVTVDIPFCFGPGLDCDDVPRFRGHVDVRVDAHAIEVWTDPIEALSATDDRQGRILLPVIITHGFMGDHANIDLPVPGLMVEKSFGLNYGSIGPGLDLMARTLAEDGYKTSGSYPTAHILIYPSLHNGGIQAIASDWLAPLVDRLVSPVPGQPHSAETYAARVDIVAHSMGGLVSRYYIESGPGLNKGDKVRKLVMIGTPNEGGTTSHTNIEGIGAGTLTFDKIVGLTPPGPTGFINTGVTTIQQLLPVFPYYREKTSTTLTGYGWTDLKRPAIMDIPANGETGNLVYNSLLNSLNVDGLDSRVDNFIIYSDHLDTVTLLDREEGFFGWSYELIKKPGDETVSRRSALMEDYPNASKDLKKCLVNGNNHPRMMLDPVLRRMVRAILILDQGEEPKPGCNPDGGPLPEDRREAMKVLGKFLDVQKSHSHLPRRLSFTKISGLAGELRQLEDRSPWAVRNLGPQLQAYVRGLSDSELSALAGALERWGLDTQVLARHAPGLGRAAQSVAENSDLSFQRNLLEQGVTASFLHNVAQASLQMMLYATAEAHSTEEAGQFASHMADLRALQGFTGQLATTRIAIQSWESIGPAIAALAAQGSGPDADEAVVNLEDLLIAVAGEEQYPGWVYRNSDGSIEIASAPVQDKGGSERARILVFLNGKVFQPRQSDNGVDWQNMGVPRLRTSSTNWVGTPSMSSAKPARWIGTVMLEEVGERLITGRVVATDGNPVPAVTVRSAVTLTDSYREQLAPRETTTGEDGRFSLPAPRGLPVLLLLSHPSARPTGLLPEVPTDNSDIDLGDIEVGATPILSRATVTPERPVRGGPFTLGVEASHPLGVALTYKWQKRISRYSWEDVGERAQLNLTASPGPESVTYRVFVSDGVNERNRYVSIVPENLPPEVLSLVSESTQVGAGQPLSLTATARDGDGDPLTYEWRCFPGCWWPFPYPKEANATWTAPWSPEDRSYTIQVRATDGALFDDATVQVTVLGRADPTVSLALTPGQGGLPLEVIFEANAVDPAGQIVEYEWQIYKLRSSFWRYYRRWKTESTSDSTFTQIFEETGMYRARVKITNDIDRTVFSDFLEIIVRAPPTVELFADLVEGQVPLTVNFTALPSGGVVEEFRWDFDGDGTVDQITTITLASHIYDQAGDFQAQVTVVDNQSLTGSAALAIAVTSRPLTVTLEAEPVDGFSPLEVTFTADASPGPIMEYRWDFDGDGTVDQTTTISTTTHTYETDGSFQAQVTAVAEDGATESATSGIAVLAAVPPTVTLAAVPNAGGAPLDVTFTAEAEDEDGQVVEYRWDFDGDGTVDETTSAATIAHIYDTLGAFQAQVTVVDDDGLTGSDTVAVDVSSCRAAVPPPGQTLPHVFVGSVTLDGAPAPDGTLVVAFIGCDVAAEGTTGGGSYNVTVAPPQGVSYVGEIVTFSIGGFTAGQQLAWSAGEASILNLTASSGGG